MHDVFNQWLNNYVMEKRLNKKRINLIHENQKNEVGFTKSKDVQFIDFSSLDDFEENAAED